jgi:hypothetical protein
MARKFGSDRLSWQGNRLYLQGSRVALLEIVPDAHYPKMWRVALPDGRLSDMVNRVRAKDAALSIALAGLRMAEQQATEAA